MARPTRTTNPIHFTDLSDRRFEDLAMQLTYRFRKWEEINPDGRSGGDRGVDIRAVERLEDGSVRKWAIQCRRYQKVTAATLKKALDDIVKFDVPDVALLVVASDVSLQARQEADNYACKKNIPTFMLWQASTLETLLYSDHPDLLFAFFGISVARDERARESTIKRNLGIKKRLAKTFPHDNFGSRLIIRSIDDTEYPNANEPPPGVISGWFRVEYCGLYYNGLEVLLRVTYALLETGKGPWATRWAFIPDLDPDFPYIGEGKGVDGAGIDVPAYVDTGQFGVASVFKVGRIPFRNIIEIDEEGDEYYSEPHVYCKFSDGGQPYEEIIAKLVKNKIGLESQNRFNLEELKSKINKNS